MADFSPPLLQTEPPSNQNKFPFPSLPPNYVTLQQLQERRLKQQQEREAKEKEEEERQRQREEAEEERKRQREAEEEERKKQLDLEKSLKTLETKPSDRSSLRNWVNRPKISADRRGEIPTVEREIDGHGKSIERSNKKKKIGKWREKTSPSERKTLTDGDPAHSLPENGKSAVDRKIGRGFRAVERNRTAKIARETEDLETKGRKEEEERSTAVEEKGRAQSPPVESLPEKIGSNVVDDRMVEIDRQKISNNEIEGSTGGGKEADGTANKKLYSTQKRKKYVKKKRGNVGVVNCDQTVEGEKEVDEGSNECGLGRRGEKMPATKEENVEKEDKAVESAHEIEELEIVDCDEVDGKNVVERSMEEKKLGDWKPRERRNFGHRRGLGYGRGFGYGRSFGYGKKKGGNVEAVNCNRIVEAAEGEGEVDEGSNECGLGRPGEKMPATGEDNVEKEDKVVEIAQKIEELEIVDCDEADGKNAGGRLMKEKKLGDWRPRERRSFGQRSGFGYGRGLGYGRKKGGNVGAGYCDQTVEGGKEVDEGLTERGLGRLGEKMPATGEDNVEKEVKAVEIAHKIEELEIIDCDEADGENAGSFGQRSSRSFGYGKKKGGNVEADQTVEAVEGGIAVEVGLNECGLRRLGEKMPATREESVEKEDKVVEIAHKIDELEIVDCDEVDGENAGERSREEKKLGDWRRRERRNFGQRSGFGYGRGFGYRRSFGYQERRQPRHLTWVRKEENSNGSMRPV